MAACSRAPERPAVAPERPEPRASKAAASEPEDRDDGLAAALAEAEAGVADPDLAALLRDHFRFVLEDDPLFATQLGVHAFDDRLPDPSGAAVARRRRMRRTFLERGRAIDPKALSEADRVTWAMFVAELSWAIDEEVCRFDEWTLSARDNPVTRWNDLPRQHKVTGPASAEAFLARVRGIPAVVDARIERLRRGADDGLFANAESVRRVLAMVDAQVAAEARKWALVSLLADVPAFEGKDEFVAAVEREVDGPVREAFRRYATFVRTRILPNARPDDAVGLAALPFGKACYAARIRSQTTLPLSAEEVHRIGREGIAATDREIARLGRSVLRTRGLAKTIRRMRTDRSLYFRTSAEVFDAARKALADARGAMPAYFGRLPKAPCEVREIPLHEAPYTTIAYYSPPHPDGSKPGEYFVNTYAPTTRPRYEARVLAFHESIPGHHLQIAIAQELPAVPAFRRHGGATAFVEGWALYVERLADEMGLYRGDLDRLGVASFDAWRAGRLVVDTGIHHLGWSRDEAKKFLAEHTLLSPENIDNEVDRYIVWPGQALAYKVGQLEILKLRRSVAESLGACFSLPRFHDAVLGGGALTLPLLRARILAWAEAEKRTCREREGRSRRNATEAPR